ncbi:unnamed protein product [Effrenium voratum]|nr:unnamed protein product [Effrenium voratum]
MTSLMDSEAVLKARLTEACLPEGNVNVLLGKQITTLRKLAYSVCTPTATASDAQLNALVKTSETEEVGVAILAAIRQVHFEAQTLAVAALKNLVEPKKDSAATELPFVERNERIRLQKGRLQGLDLSGALENAHSNYDLVFAMREQNSLKYLGPAKFPSRKQEVMQEKCLQELKVDSSGSIVFSEKKKDMEAELGTELLMRDALTRRALSFDLVLARVRTDPSVVYHLLQAPVSQKQVCAKTQSRVGAAHAVTMCVLSWATAEEVAYPPDLCKQWARAVVDELVELGAKPPPNELQQHGPDARTMRAQPRTKRLPPLVPPFKATFKLSGLLPDLPSGPTLKQAWPVPESCTVEPSVQFLPAGAKLVRTIFLGGSGSAADSSGEHNLDDAEEMSNSNIRLDQLPEWVNSAMPCTAHPSKAETENEAVAGREALQIFGIPWSPDEFLQQAALRKHPRDLVQLLPHDLSDVVECNSPDTATACALGRTETIRRWAFKALELRAEDARLCAAAPEHCRETLSAKRPAMLKFLLDEIGYEDRDLPQQLLTGFDLTGPVPVSNVFRPRIRPATITRDELRAHAGRLREATLSSIRSSGDPLVDQELYKVTCEEVRKGWLRGPFKESDIPSHSSVSRRFPVVQHGKVRPIDDMAASCINMATATAEAISVHNCDVVVGLAVSLMRADSNCQGQQLLLRSWDLSKAYKQFAISLESLDDAYIALFRPGGGHEIYQAVVLPFGSVASVNNFVRCAFAAWTIGVRALKLPWCAYFDDYVCFAWESVANHTAMVVRALFSFIGFQTADDKGCDFSAVCIVLGLEVSIGPWDRAIVKVSNTEDRKLKLTAAIGQVLEDGKIKPSHWETLKGRLQFAEAQIWGRGAAFAMKTLRRHLDGARRVFEANEAVRAALEWIRDRILLAPPRQLAAKEMPVRHIYVDVCYESSSDSKA